MARKMFENFKKLLHNRLNRKSIYCTPDYWNSKADEFDSSAVSMWVNTTLNYHYKNELYEIINKLNLQYKNLKVLDLGCGTGAYSRWFASQGARVKGLDFSEKSINIARRLSSEYDIEYETASILDLQETDKYDLVFVSGVISVASKSKDEVIKILTDLKPLVGHSGLIFFAEPFHKGFLSRVLELNIKEFIDIMNSLEFNILLKESIHFWPIRLLLCYYPLPKFITTPLFYLGKFLIKLPLLSKLCDYWCVAATIK
jgi:2-polyprenyl-3-methyl-5-hydroxy-6-metoxy-1,4-benzoquinol methylase